MRMEIEYFIFGLLWNNPRHRHRWIYLLKSPSSMFSLTASTLKGFISYFLFFLCSHIPVKILYTAIPWYSSASDLIKHGTRHILMRKKCFSTRCLLEMRHEFHNELTSTEVLLNFIYLLRPNLYWGLWPKLVRTLWGANKVIHQEFPGSRKGWQLWIVAFLGSTKFSRNNLTF